MKTARDYIDKLNLTPHPEGGWYREFFRSPGIVDVQYPGSDTKKRRAGSTAIYYLLEDGDFSAFHRIKSDEYWHYIDGEALDITEINPGGELITHRCGKNMEKNEQPVVIIEGGSWFGASIPGKSGFSLVCCVVAPGFDFSDFEMAHRQDLLNAFPLFEGVINHLTRI